ADYILRDDPRAVSIFITADRADRRDRLAVQRNMTPAAAETLMDKTDARRAAYYNYYSSGVWGEAATYHLCVNSSVLGVEGTAEFVLEFVQRKLNLKF
ncbi:MAG: cytidylate kinase family protein, partial [Alistipes sp.]